MSQVLTQIRAACLRTPDRWSNPRIARLHDYRASRSEGPAISRHTSEVAAHAIQQGRIRAKTKAPDSGDLRSSLTLHFPRGYLEAISATGAIGRRWLPYALRPWTASD